MINEICKRRKKKLRQAICNIVKLSKEENRDENKIMATI